MFITEPNTHYCCGGKADKLLLLKHLGFNVPRFVVIPAEAFEESLECESEQTAMRHKAPSQWLSQEKLEQLLALLPGATHFAVRSSAPEEDGAAHSFAGQFDTFLFVDREQLAEKINLVWHSAQSDRVREYRQTHQLADGRRMAVIVQEMIDADVSGVAFGVHPISGNRKEVMINAVYGLGEGLVSGELNADVYVVGESSMSRELAYKTHKVSRNECGGTCVTAIPDQLREQACLTDAQVQVIRETLYALYRHQHCYQDIEFAFKDEHFFLLQSRPVTTCKQLPDSSGEHIIWDNSNIIESYPGVTTPLTFSFIRPVYEAVYRQFALLMGVSAKEVENNSETFANMLGLLDGRVYYNLLSWYKALALLPGYSLNAGFMEKMMGVKERFELKKLPDRSRWTERLRVLNMIRILLKNLSRLPAMRNEFKRDFETTMRQYTSLDLNQKNVNELMQLYLDFEKTLLKKWKAPLVNDFFAMIYFGTLQKLVVSYGIDELGTLHNDLMCGSHDIISTEPVSRCLALSAAILDDHELKHLFLEKTATELSQMHTRKELPIDIGNQIDDYLSCFGNRCVGELKLETLTYAQQPEVFFNILKSYVSQGLRPGESKNHELMLRTTAEKRVTLSLKNKPLKRIIFKYVLKRARSLVSARENLRYERTRAFGVVRTLFCTIGERFYAESLIADTRDIFYLRKDEIFDYINGTSVNGDLKALIALRKTQFASYESATPSERIDTRGPVYQGNQFFAARQQPAVTGDLKGLGCCPGRVRGKVRVVKHPAEVQELHGDILVTSSTDPGWVTLFPSASAILVERGSLLSHSAIVSRELGIPCIVGITGLLERLKTGDEVEIDGASGHIRLINS